MKSEIVVVTVTAADPEWLASFARELVRDGLIACANVLPAVTSIYRWAGEVEQGSESLAILHTGTDRVAALEERVARDHPYAVAQFVVLPATASPAYAAWVAEPFERRG